MKLTKIHEDDRGVISIMEGFAKYPECTVFETKAGKARGGCIHNINDEYCCVLEGEILYSIGNNAPIEMTVGDSVMIPKATPHYFESLTDSVVLEWGATAEEKKEKHKEFRTIVEDINNDTSI